MDATLLAVARGNVDVGTTNRVFTHEEEVTLRTALGKKNVHLYKPVIQRLAVAIHSTQHSTLPPAYQHPHSPPCYLTFRATDRVVERIKREFHLSPQKPQIRRRSVEKKAEDWGGGEAIHGH